MVETGNTKVAAEETQLRNIGENKEMPKKCK